MVVSRRLQQRLDVLLDDLDLAKELELLHLQLPLQPAIALPLLGDGPASLVAQEMHHLPSGRLDLILQHHVPLLDQSLKVLAQVPRHNQLRHLRVQEDSRRPSNVGLL